MRRSLLTRTGRALLSFCIIALPFGSLAAPAAFGQSLAAGDDDTAVVDADGALWVWGSDAEGQLGIDSGAMEPVPVKVEGSADWVQIAAGSAHKLAIRSDGSLWSWGRNAEGQLGRNDFEPDPLPGRIGFDNHWVAVAAGATHSLALDADGNLWSWGANVWGQLGNNSRTGRTTPVKLDVGPFQAIAAGLAHSVAIAEDGSLWTWGSNVAGQLGTGSVGGYQLTPIQIGTATDWEAIAAGLEFALAIRSDGSLWSWGNNVRGQLGYGAASLAQGTPARVGTGSDWAQIAAGDVHSMAIRNDGSLWTWGHGFQGQLGHGNSLDEYRPRQVGSDTNWIAIAAGALHSVALRSDGIVWSSGLNEHGQLGNGTTESTYAIAPSYFGVPDLILTGLLPPETLELGESFAMNVFAENLGSGGIDSSTPIEIEMRLSEVPQWNHASNVSLDTFQIARDVLTQEAFNVDQSLTLPARLLSGHYFFGARINGSGAIVESDSENNVFWMEVPMPFLADLHVAAPQFAAQVLQPGESIAGQIPLSNIGSGDISADIELDLHVRLSQDRTWGNSDDIVLVESQPLSDGVDAGEQILVDLDPAIVVPEFSPLGDYYVGAWIDREEAIEEQSEDNNREWSELANIQVDRPTLEDSVSDLDLDLNWTTGGDGSWFGQDDENSGNSARAAQSPPLAEGESAWFEASVSGPSFVTFNWKSETQSADNYLMVTIDGAEQARISGTTEWHEEGFLVSAPLSRLRFTYVSNGTTDGTDKAWVADLRIEPVSGPDLVVTGVEYPAGNYVLESSLNGASVTIKAIGKNQGLETDLPEDFKMEVRLSMNPFEGGEEEEIVLGELTKLSDLDADNRFVYEANVILPDTLPAGAYHVGIFADILADEFDLTNNSIWSEAADLVIEHRPDLRATNLAYEVEPLDPGQEDRIFTIHSPESEEPDELVIEFDLVNSGLANASAEPFTVNAYLSPDRVLDDGDVLLTGEEVADGLHAGQSRPWSFVTRIPETAELGLFQYLIISVDTFGETPESNEGNNTTISDLADIFVQEMPIGLAVGRPELVWVTGNSRENAPWYGQSAVAFGGQEPVGAARAAKNLRQWEGSHMETTVITNGPSPVSFFWKVDSDELYEQGALIAHNYLSFSIDGQEQARISGAIDWHQQTFLLPEAGTYKLRWSYIKELPTSGGADTGWVDQISYQVPDLVLEDVVVLSPGGFSGPYEPGESLRYEVTIRNNGSLPVPLTPSYSVQVRLSPEQNTAPNLDWTTSEADQIILDTFELTDSEQRALEPGEELTLAREALIPSELTADARFYLGAWVDYTYRIVEGNKDNNLWWTPTNSIELLAPLSLAEAVDFAPTHPDGWVIGGSRSWFGQGDTFDGNIAALPGNASAGQTPTIETNEEAWFAAEVEGPAVMDFSWKISSRENFNYLRLYVSGGDLQGSPIAEIHGERDWTRESVFIPAGPQTIRWSYEKTGNAGDEDLDTAWVDGIRFIPVTKPDLRITSVEYEAGSYVLERDRLTMTISVENRGADFPDGLPWDTSDLEVRLSKNQVPGEGEEYVLGHFARVEEFERDEGFTTGARLVFSGDIELPTNMSEGNYYLIARFDPFAKLDEFDTANNLWIEGDNDIAIRRLPNLVPDHFAVDSSKAYFPYAPMEIDWVLRNVGLGDVTGDIPYVQEVRLMALDRQGGDISDAIHVATLSDFTENAYLPGVSFLHPNGTGRTILSRVTLPSPANILAGLGEVDPGLEEGDAEVVSKWPVIYGDYVYYISIVVDAGIDIEQSSDLRIFHYAGDLFDIHSPGGMPTRYEEWLALYPGLSADPTDLLAGDVSALAAYALNLNPLTLEAGAGNLFSAFGKVAVDGDEYFRMSFNMVKDATDLLYHIEVSDDLVHWVEITTLEPPYSGGSLIDHPLVVSASDQGYTAAVTVRDQIPMENIESGRFFRLRIERVD